MNEHTMTMADILEAGLNVTPPVQIQRPLPRSVETTAKNIENTFVHTADLLEATAERLESHAHNLRDKAERLRQAAPLADEIRESVRFEREAFEEVQSLALVNVQTRPQDS